MKVKGIFYLVFKEMKERTFENKSVGTSLSRSSFPAVIHRKDIFFGTATENWSQFGVTPPFNQISNALRNNEKNPIGVI